MPLRATLVFVAALGFALLPAESFPQQTPSAEADAPPLIDPAVALHGAAPVQALRAGGYVLYMRHAQVSTVTPTCEASNLTASGEDQARLVGTALRTIAVPVGLFLVSPACRTQDTARLLGIGTPQVDDQLSPSAPPGVNLMAARKKLLATVPAPGTNTVLVSHVFGGEHREDWIHLELAEVIVYRPDGQGGAQAVARIPVAEWASLAASHTP